MAEWLYEEGIGENRAALVDDSGIVEAAIERPGGIRAGSVVAGRLREILIPGRRGLVEAYPEWLLVEPLPQHLTKGRMVLVEVTREPIFEPGNAKYAKGQITDRPEQEGPSLVERIGKHTQLLRTDPDRLEQAGWTELIEDAISGEITFVGGELRVSLTPAMTLIDVDGALPPAELAVTGADAAGRTIRRHDITGSIGIDLPTLPARTDRQRAAHALDGVLPKPFERTAVNGFGFLQVVRRRTRRSIPELLRDDPVGASARMLLRKAERSREAGPLELTGAPEVIAFIAGQPAWLEQLSRRSGAQPRLRANPAHAMWGGNVQSAAHLT